MLEQETIREPEGRWKQRPTLTGSDYTEDEDGRVSHGGPTMKSTERRIQRALK